MYCTCTVSAGPRPSTDCYAQCRRCPSPGKPRKWGAPNRGRTRPPSPVTMNARTSLWALLLQPQGSDLLPPARSHIWRAQSESLREWIIGNGCKARIRSPSSLWSSLHQTPVPHGFVRLSRPKGKTVFRILKFRLKNIIFDEIIAKRKNKKTTH